MSDKPLFQNTDAQEAAFADAANARGSAGDQGDTAPGDAPGAVVPGAAAGAIPGSPLAGGAGAAGMTSGLPAAGPAVGSAALAEDPVNEPEDVGYRAGLAGDRDLAAEDDRDRRNRST